MELSFTKNGKWMGIAFRIQKEALGGQALYPHVLVKNCAVEFNFGQRAEPYCSILPGFTFIQHLPLSERIRGTIGPKSKAECEVSRARGLNWWPLLQSYPRQRKNAKQFVHGERDRHLSGWLLCPSSLVEIGVEKLL